MAKIYLSKFPYYLFWKLMKWTTIVYSILLVLLFAAQAKDTHGQVNFGAPLSFQTETLTLRAALAKISKQTGVDFAYNTAALPLREHVALPGGRYELKEALDVLSAAFGLEYREVGKSVLLLPKARQPAGPARETQTIQVEQYQDPQTQDWVIEGVVIDAETKEPVVGATIRAEKRYAITDKEGKFVFRVDKPTGPLVIKHIGYKEQSLAYDEKTITINIQLEPIENALDEAVVIGYGTTTRRNNTGSVGKLSSKDIEKQPVSNVLGTLQGRISGLEVTETSGLPGAGFQIRIRGQNSITQGSEPYIIVDGVPLNDGNNGVDKLSNAMGSGSISPLNFLNPADIESIEVLKDADATAIFGSKGANGVIIITTKKNKAGELTYSVNSELRLSTPSRTMDMMNTQEYVAMRKEAFKNDGMEINVTTAPDIALWDTTQYTDFSDLLIGKLATTKNTQFGMEAGTKHTNYRLNGAFNEESTVFPGQSGNRRATLGMSVGHRSANERLEMSFSANYGRNNSRFTNQDLTTFIRLPPHVQLYDTDGNLNWSQEGISFKSLGISNPLAYLEAKYSGQFSTLSTAMNVNYRVWDGLNLRVGMGYNTANGSEGSQTPSKAIDPTDNTLPYASFAESGSTGWLIEPQVHYKKKLRGFDFSVLLGSTFQANENNSLITNGYDYTSDILLGSISGAGRVISSNSAGEYRYTALFGRTSVSYKDTYILNLTARRDGSSRFGPGNRFANFGAVGGAWIFSNERFFNIPEKWISFAKLRASYGSTGNDQIGDYQYLDSWSPTIAVYENLSILQPNRLLNPYYSWEVNKKMELALEWSMFNNRLSFTTNWYRNRSDNQLVNYKLPIQTGFPTIIRNLDAIVENKGWEIEISATPVAKRWQWETAFNASAQRNTLVSFPNFEQSSYANQYVIGQPLNVRRLYEYTGIDPATGIYRFVDINNDGRFDINDRTVNKTVSPIWYGGWSNTFRYKQFSLDIFTQFAVQEGYSFRRSVTAPPGYRATNQPRAVLDRWQVEGDGGEFQRYVIRSGTPAYTAANSYINSSDALFTDASFVRIKNMGFTYMHSPRRNGVVKNVLFAIRAQNPFTFTGYDGTDPETQEVYVLPPMKTLSFNIKLTL